MRARWKSAEEYLEWMEKIETSANGAEAETAKTLLRGIWPSVLGEEPKEKREKKRLMSILPELILYCGLNREYCSAGKERSGNRNQRGDDIAERIRELGQALLLCAEILKAAELGEGNGRISGECAGDPTDFAQTE